MATSDFDPEFVASIREGVVKRAAVLTEKQNGRTAQDNLNVGRVAHFHTLVEHELFALLSSIAPQLGDLGNVGLSFSLLVKLGSEAARFLGDKGFPSKELSALNELRNGFAHKMNFDATQSPLVKNLREFLKNLGATEVDEASPVEVFEHAALAVCRILAVGIALREKVRSTEREMRQIAEESLGIIASKADDS